MKQQSIKRKAFFEHLATVAFSIALATVIILVLAAPHITELRVKAEAREALREISNHDSGDTIEEVIKTIQEERPQYEIIIVFDEKGNKLIEHTDENPYDVSLPDDALTYLAYFDNLTHVHNHPFTDSGHSDNDLVMPVRTGLSRSVTTLAVIGTKHVFYMHCNESIWPTPNQFVGYTTYLSQVYDGDNELMGSIIVGNIERYYYTTAFLERMAEDFGYTFEIVDPSLSQ